MSVQNQLYRASQETAAKHQHPAETGLVGRTHNVFHGSH